MSLADEYRAQAARRGRPRLEARLPDLAGRTLLDLGCAVGADAERFAALGARVIGVDLNEDLLRAARERGIRGAEFRVGDLRDPPDADLDVDGVLASFVAAYFVDLPPLLRTWTRRLRRGGFILLTEIDDLFAHEPLEPRFRALLDAYVDEARAAGRYDFRMRRRLADVAAAAGLDVVATEDVPDREFTQDGPAAPDVLAAWDARLRRMSLLLDRAGSDADALRSSFLATLTRPDHRVAARVVCCLAVKP